MVVIALPSITGWDVQMDEWTHGPSDPASIDHALHQQQTLHW
ncbi:hypothetical protein [Hydrogenophaga sp.]|nr:hypothetical protein [Hydrogenophaga sp.]MDO9438819.1 hypothetical protein [Hydrogenophaga sp.]